VNSTPVKTNSTAIRLRLLPPSSRPAPLDRIVDHLAELERILVAGHNRAEAMALGRIRGDLAAIR
jgi:hypothetical protein